MDKMHKQIQLEALAFAFCATMFLSISYGFLENVGFPSINWMWVGGIMIGLWGIGGAIASMLKAVDIEVSQRSGSRVLLKKGVERIVIHRPHPETGTGRATVSDITAFLKAIGVKP